MGKGNSGSGSSTVVQNSGPPPAFLGAYQSLINNAQATASRPYQPYTDQLVAGFNPMQTSAFNSIEGSANLAQPDIAQAKGIFENNANTNLWGQLPQLNSADINQYQNPYTQDVTQATEAQFANLNAQQQSGLIGNAINAGAFGGDRAAVAQGILGGQQAAQEAPVLAGIQQQGYNTALSTAQQQQGAQLGALEAQGWLGSQSAFGLGQLGGESQNLAQSGAQSILGVGNMQQQLAQEQLNIPFYQYQAQQAYPFQTQNWLANIEEGAGSLAGGQGTTQTNLPNQGDGTGQIIGDVVSLAALAALAARGGRIPHRAPGGGILPQGIPIYPRRAPGGGILDYGPGGAGAGGIFDYVPDAGGGIHGPGVPPAPRSVPAYTGKQADAVQQNMPLLAMLAKRYGSSSGLGGYMGSGVSDAEMAGLSSDAMMNVAGGAAGLRRGGGIFAQRSYDDGGSVDDMDLTSPEIGEGAVPLRYVQDSPYQDPNWTPARGGITRGGPMVDDPRVSDAGDYALEGEYPARASASSSPSSGILPSSTAQKDDSPYGYEGYQAPDRASSGPAPWKIGLLAAGLGILGHHTRGHPLAGAEEGIRAYAEAQGEQDRYAEQEAAKSDESAYRKANLKREGEQFSQNIDLSKQKLKQAGAQHDEQMQIERDRLAQTGAYQTGELAARNKQLGISQQQANTAEQYRKAEMGAGSWETGTQTDPTTGKDVKGAWFTPKYGGEPVFHAGVDMTERGDRGTTASQWKYNAWLSAHPGDEQGALDFVGGHKQMGEGDVVKSAHAMAQGDYKALFGDGSRPPPADADAWLRQRAEEYAGQLRAGRQPSGGSPADPLGIR